MKYRVAAIQMNLVYKNPEENCKKAKLLIEKAMLDGPDMIILPETWTTGYSEEVFNNIDKYAEDSNGPSTTLLCELAKSNNVWIVAGSIPERKNNKIYNTSFLINREGNLVGSYSKVHLYSDMDEDVAFEHGDAMPVFETEFGKIALMICYDIRFPELARSYAVRGANLIISVSNWEYPRLDHWRILQQSRAIENQLYFIACNRVGYGSNEFNFGRSMVIDPWGDIQIEGTEEESIVFGEIDTEKVDEIRKIIPVFYDRRPNTYLEDMLNSKKIY